MVLLPRTVTDVLTVEVRDGVAFGAPFAIAMRDGSRLLRVHRDRFQLFHEALELRRDGRAVGGIEQRVVGERDLILSAKPRLEVSLRTALGRKRSTGR